MTLEMAVDRAEKIARLANDWLDSDSESFAGSFDRRNPLYMAYRAKLDDSETEEFYEVIRKMGCKNNLGDDERSYINEILAEGMMATLIE